MYISTVYTCCIRSVACNWISCATCLMQLHKFVVACVACNWILVACDNCKTQNFLVVLHEGNFFLACPSGPKMYLIWMWRAHSDLVKDVNDEHYRMVHVQWWVPFKKRTHNNAQLYWGYWEGKWKCNLSNPM